ncbi:MAG: hypothetical protein K0Q46_2735 [Rhodococcus erythropolis]|jgi:hypothetical protein|nr:hypothetical protein [Rhodococcus erythropolis]
MTLKRGDRGSGLNVDSVDVHISSDEISRVDLVVRLPAMVFEIFERRLDFTAPPAGTAARRPCP